MKHLPLATDHTIPQLGLGTWQLRGKACTQAIHQALDLGYTHIDTAWMYDNQKAIGIALQETSVDRSNLFITSKVWHTHLHFDGVLEHCEEALRDLRTDYLDLFLIHWPNTTVPLSETLRAMDHIFDSGKAKSIGVSNFPVDLLKEATQTAQSPICVNQVEYNLIEAKPDVLQYCQNHNILVTAHTPLGKGGVLRNRKLADLANRYEKTSAQIALRWLTQQGIVVIPKAGSTVHMQENMDIFNWNLSEEDLMEAGSAS